MDKKNKGHIELNRLSHDVYSDNEFVKNYAERIEYNAHNALYERPATLSLLPEVTGMKVLDAGCGPGAYTEWLLDNGADVTAIDYSEEMLSVAQKRAGGRARMFLANLNEPMTFLNNEEFDMILSSMVLHYLKDWRVTFSEFSRILKSGGEFVFSVHHPFMDFKFHPDGNYHETELVEDNWPAYNIRMKYYRRPLSHVFNVLKETDFVFRELLEPKPLEACKEQFPNSYEQLSRKPWFICFKAEKSR